MRCRLLLRMFAVSVCLSRVSTRLHCTKMAKRIEILFGIRLLGAQGTLCLTGVLITSFHTQREREIRCSLRQITLASCYLYIAYEKEVNVSCFHTSDGSQLVSSAAYVHGSNVRARQYWGDSNYSSWIDYSNVLPTGLLQRYYVFAQPTGQTANIGTAIARIQIWREIPRKSYRYAFQLVWERRILVLPCNSTHGALHEVATSEEAE